MIQDQFISNRHLKVTRREAGFHVLDLNSTNGTFLGGAGIFEAEIPLGTALRVGETELHFEPVSQGQPQAAFHGIIGHDPAIRQLMELIQRVAPSTATVTILGESGTGKELVARAVHECSPRADVVHRALLLRSRFKARSSLYTRLKAWGLVSEDEEAD